MTLLKAIVRYLGSHVSFRQEYLNSTLAQTRLFLRELVWGAFAWFRKAIISFVMPVLLSVRPHGTTRLPPDGFSWNLVFEYVSKVCRETSGIVKIGQKESVLYMKTSIHFLSYLAHFFLEWEMFQIKVIEKIKTYVLCSVTFDVEYIYGFVMLGGL